MVENAVHLKHMAGASIRETRFESDKAVPFGAEMRAQFFEQGFASVERDERHFELDDLNASEGFVCALQNVFLVALCVDF